MRNSISNQTLISYRVLMRHCDRYCFFWLISDKDCECDSSPMLNQKMAVEVDPQRETENRIERLSYFRNHDRTRLKWKIFEWKQKIVLHHCSIRPFDQRDLELICRKLPRRNVVKHKRHRVPSRSTSVTKIWNLVPAILVSNAFSFNVTTLLKLDNGFKQRVINVVHPNVLVDRRRKYDQ